MASQRPSTGPRPLLDRAAKSPPGSACSSACSALVGAIRRWLSSKSAGGAYLMLALGVVLGSFAVAASMSSSILSADCGTAEMQEIAGTIKDGASGFLRVQYCVVFASAVVVSALLAVMYMFRPAITPELETHKLSLVVHGLLLLLKAFCSALAGYVGVCTRPRQRPRRERGGSGPNARRAGPRLRGGAVSAIPSAGMCILGVSLLYGAAYVNFSISPPSTPEDPRLHRGLRLRRPSSASSCSSAAASTPRPPTSRRPRREDREQDSRGRSAQPGRDRDLMGDNVGDCAGSMADVFESISGEIIGAMILGGELAAKSGVAHPERFVFFPVVVHACDLIVSIAGIWTVRPAKAGRSSKSRSQGPLKVMQNAYLVSIFAHLHPRPRPLAAVERPCRARRMVLLLPLWPRRHHLLVLLFLSTQYDTDYAHGPVEDRGRLRDGPRHHRHLGHLGLGMESCALRPLS